MKNFLVQNINQLKLFYQTLENKDKRKKFNTTVGLSPSWVRIEKLLLWLLLKNYNGKLDCLIYELLFIKEKKPSLNTQSDCILAKLFVTYFHLHVQTCYFCSPVYFVTLNRIYIRSVFSFYLCHLIMMSLWHRNVVLNLFRLTKFNLIRKLFYDKENYANLSTAFKLEISN